MTPPPWRTENRRIVHVLVAAMATHCGACDNCGGASPAAGQQPWRTEAQELVDVPDRSLTMQEYEDSGVPDIGRAWSAADLAQAVNALEKVHEADPSALPRRNSRRSGELFTRLVARDNMGAIVKSPIEARMQEAAAYGNAWSMLVNLYASALQKHRVSYPDFLEMSATTLHVLVFLFDVSETFLATLTPADLAYPNRLEGFQKLQKGAATTMVGTLQMLQERKAYGFEEKRELLESVSATFPSLHPRLEAASKVDILDRLESMVKTPELSSLRGTLSRLHRRLDAK